MGAPRSDNFDFLSAHDPELSRKQLRAVKLALDAAGYGELSLRIA